MFEDVLGYLGDALGKPGRAAKGAIDLLAGGSTDPTELAAFVPFSDSLGLTNQANAISGKDLFTRHLGSTGSEWGDEAAGFATDMLTDPTTYFGGALGRMGGKALGMGLGRNLEAAAVAHGPGYANGAESLLASTLKGGGRDAAGKFEDLMGHPAFGKAIQEVPPGSQYIGSGAEAVAFRTPTGDVARMGLSPVGAETRPIHEAVLQANRIADYAGAGKAGIRVERSPYAKPLTDIALERTEPLSQIMNRADQLVPELKGSGIDFFDTHMGNVGMSGGRPVVLDPGAVTWMEGMPRPAYAPSITHKDPNKMQRYLLSLLKSQPEMQQRLAAGLSGGPQYQDAFGRLGGAAGALAGGSLGAF